MSADFDEPTIPPVSQRVRRVLVAGWLSLGLHAALIALVQVVPPAAISLGEPVIEARLVSTHAAPPAVTVPPLTPAEDTPEVPPADSRLLVSDAATDAQPVAQPAVAPPVQAAPPAPSPVAATPSVEPQPAAAVTPPAPAVALTSAVDLTYYSARDVDMQARPLREFDLKYPDAADRRRLSGKVRLNIKVEADGRVSGVEFVSATHPDIYDESKMKVILDMPFSPAMKNGHPVRELYQIEVEYDWEGRPR
ncbi:MAG: energy transducer TonB [Thiobacillus sp.]|nr:energy transducer TonB [Thiobacillus sp.]